VGSTTPHHHRHHRPGAAGLHRIRNFLLYTEQICYHILDKYRYASSDDVKLFKQALRRDVLTLRP
jgi:hypothetical protein